MQLSKLRSCNMQKDPSFQNKNISIVQPIPANANENLGKKESFKPYKGQALYNETFGRNEMKMLSKFSLAGANISNLNNSPEVRVADTKKNGVQIEPTKILKKHSNQFNFDKFKEAKPNQLDNLNTNSPAFRKTNDLNIHKLQEICGD